MRATAAFAWCPNSICPGHSTAWFVGYPELASGAGPYQIERKWGVFDPAMDPTNEKTYKFLNEFIAEMAKLFPDQYFHIGGDEVNGKQWDANPKIQEFMKSHDIKNNEGLQAYFSQHVQELVVKHGKTPVGWDEILVPGVSKEYRHSILAGRGCAGQRQRSRAIGEFFPMATTSIWDGARRATMPWIRMGGAAANLTPEEKERILGGEATHVVGVRQLGKYRFAHLAANGRDRGALLVSAKHHGRSFDVCAHGGGKHAPGMAGADPPHLSATDDAAHGRVRALREVDAVLALAEALEPVKDYNRETRAATNQRN